MDRASISSLLTYYSILFYFIFISFYSLYHRFREFPATQGLWRAYVILPMRAFTHGGLGTPTSQRNILIRRRKKKITFFFNCVPSGVRTSGLWISSPTLYQSSHPATLPPGHPATPQDSTLTLTSSPRWGTADAEMNDPLVRGSPWLPKVSSAEACSYHNIALHAAPFAVAWT